MLSKYQGKKLNPNRLKMTNSEFQGYKDNSKIRYFYNNDTGEIVKYDIDKTDLKKVKTKKYDISDPDTAYELTPHSGGELFKQWGVKRLNNKAIIKGSGKMKNISLFKNIPADADVKVIVHVVYDVLCQSGEDNIILKRHKYYGYHEKANKYDMELFIKDEVSEYLKGFAFLGWKKEPDDFDFENQRYLEYRQIGKRQIKELEVTYKILSAVDINKEFTFKANGRMKKIEYYDIHNLYNNIFEMEYYENCIRDLLKEIFKSRISNKTIDKLGNEYGVTPNELYDFCVRYDIKLIIYDIEGNIIKDYYPTKRSARKAIIGIYYNGHFVPVQNKALEKVKIPTETKILSEKELNIQFDKLIKDKIIPSNVTMNTESINNDNQINIYSFANDGVQYIGNDDYDMCLKILEVLGLKDKMTPYTTLSNIYKIIETLFENDNTSSFFPVKYNKKAYNYSNPDINIDKYYNKFRSIDKNKCYSYCLMILEYLIVCDYRTAKIRKGDDIDCITPYYLYVCDPKRSNILMESMGIYAGYHVLYCEDKIEFDILEEIECTYTKNHYGDVIKLLYEKFDGEEDDKIIKDICNRMIGSFEKKYSISKSWNISKIADEQERWEDNSYDYVKRDDMYLKIDSNETVKNIYNKRPIRYQIIDYANILIYEKIKELGLTNKNIISIRTDEITFINDDKQFEKIEDELGHKLNEWKSSKIKDIEEYKIDYSTTLNQDVSFYITDGISNNNKLYDCYAGAGKTHDVIYNLIPKLKKDYIVLTPSHNASKIYRKLKLNCKTIQTYSFNNNVPLPKENNIIIDEIGLCDNKANETIYKLFLLGKNIYAYGDFKQLLPPTGGQHFNSEQYLNMIYSNIITMSTNWRNNFTKQYYDDLINNKVDLKKEIKKHNSKDLYKSEIILCRTNDECDEYNIKILDHLNIDYKIKYVNDKKNIIDFGNVGCNIMCYSNNLRNKNIYNSFTYTIKEVNKDFITLDDEDQTIILRKQLNDYFKPAYAITFYKSQGQEYRSIYIPDTSIRGITTREAYTLISRLKEDIIKDNKVINNEITINITAMM